MVHSDNGESQKPGSDQTPENINADSTDHTGDGSNTELPTPPRIPTAAEVKSLIAEARRADEEQRAERAQQTPEAVRARVEGQLYDAFTELGSPAESFEAWLKDWCLTLLASEEQGYWLQGVWNWSGRYIYPKTKNGEHQPIELLKRALPWAEHGFTPESYRSLHGELYQAYMFGKFEKVSAELLERHGIPGVRRVKLGLALNPEQWQEYPQKLGKIFQPAVLHIYTLDHAEAEDTAKQEQNPPRVTQAEQEQLDYRLPELAELTQAMLARHNDFWLGLRAAISASGLGESERDWKLTELDHLEHDILHQQLALLQYVDSLAGKRIPLAPSRKGAQRNFRTRAELRSTIKEGMVHLSVPVQTNHDTKKLS